MGDLFHQIPQVLLLWLPLVLMCLMVYFLWRVVKLTPRVQTAARGDALGHARLAGTTSPAWRR